MLLTLSSTSAYAQTSESQSNLGLATTLGPKFRVSGAQLLAGAPTGSVISLVWGGPGLIRVQLVCANAGGQTYVLLAVGGGADPVAASTATGNISSGAQYDIRGTYGAAGRSIGVYTTGGTLVASGSDTAITLPNADADNGIVRIGYPPITAPGAMEGGAWYSQAPPANGDAPRATDSGILWAVLDNVVGQLVSGATDLDDLDGASWGAGGTWDPPAPPEHSAAVTDTHPTQTDAAAATGAEPDHSAVATDAQPMQVDAATTTHTGVAHSVEISESNPLQTDTAAASQGPFHTVGVADSNPAQVDGASVAGVAPGAIVWGFLGDSQTDEYQGTDDRGPATVLNWMEMLVERGRINAGSWGARSEPRRTGYAHNWARSGAQSPTVISDQLAGLAAEVAAGVVTHVAYMATGNDWLNTSGPLYALTIYNGDGTEDSEGELLTDIIATFVGWHETIMDAIDAALDTAGSGGGMVVLTPQDYLASPPGVEAYPDPTRRGWITGVIEAIHSQVAAYAASLNSAAGYTRFSVVRGDEYLLPVWATGDGTYVTLSGVAVDYTEGWEYDPDEYDPRLLILASTGGLSHAGTLMGGEYVRAFIDGANQLDGVVIAPITDAEIIGSGGIDTTHTATASDTQPAQTDAAAATGAEPDHSAAVADVNPSQIDAASGSGAAPAQVATVTDAHPAQSDAAASTHGEPEFTGAVDDQHPAQVDAAGIGAVAALHGGAVADANPLQIDAAAGGHAEPEHSGSVADAQPMQVDASEATGATVAQSASVAEANPLQSDIVGAGFSEAAHSAAVAETNPMQVDAVAVPQIRPASAIVDDPNPPQVDGVGVDVVPATHGAAVGDLQPMQVDDAEVYFDVPHWLLAITDWHPMQIDGAAIVQEIGDFGVGVEDWNPAQEDAAVGVMIAPVGVIIGDAHPMQVDAAYLEHMPLVPIGPYRGVMSIQSRAHPLAIDSSAHILAIEEVG